MFSKKFWDRLSADEKKIAAGRGDRGREVPASGSRDNAAGDLADLKKDGMQVTELSAAELDKMREKMKPVIAKHGAASPPRWTRCRPSWASCASECAGHHGRYGPRGAR